MSEALNWATKASKPRSAEASVLPEYSKFEFEECVGSWKPVDDTNACLELCELLAGRKEQVRYGLRVLGQQQVYTAELGSELKRIVQQNTSTGKKREVRLDIECLAKTIRDRGPATLFELQKAASKAKGEQEGRARADQLVEEAHGKAKAIADDAHEAAQQMIAAADEKLRVAEDADERAKENLARVKSNAQKLGMEAAEKAAHTAAVAKAEAQRTIEIVRAEAASIKRQAMQSQITPAHWVGKFDGKYGYTLFRVRCKRPQPLATQKGPTMHEASTR